MEQILNNLSGTWELASWTHQNKDGDVDLPFGDKPQGSLVYDIVTMSMSVHIMRSNRPKHLSSGFFETQDTEAATSFCGYIAYSGSFDLDVQNQKLIHYPQVSSFPNWEGQAQERAFILEDDCLTLVAELEGVGRQVLVWKRKNRS